MAEKRFKNMGNDIFQLGEWWCSAGGEHCADVIATAMNQLIEENNRLKNSVRRQEKSNDECSKYIEEIVKENKELRSKVDDKTVAVEVSLCEQMEKVFSVINRKIDELNEDTEVSLIPRESIRILNELKEELKKL